jgi:SSS family solute:Na+ symporter
LTGIDWFVISLYLAAMLGLSLWIGRRQRDLGDYYLGGRRLPWWAVGVSVLATQSSAISFVSVPAFVALRDGGGFAWLHYELSLPLAMVLLGLWLVPVLRASGVTTIYEFLEDRFDVRVRRAVGAMFLLARGLATGVALYATAIVVEVCIGLRLEYTILLIGGVTLVYDMLGGMTAVVVSDVIQGIVLAVGLVLLVWLAADAAGGLAAAWAAFPSQRTATLYATGEPAELWAFVLGGFFLYASYYGCDQSQTQRLLSTRSVGDARRALALNGVVRFPLTLGYLLLGVVAAAVFAGDAALRGAVPADAPEYLIPELVLATMPAGLRGLIFAALMAAGMSSLDSAINALSASSVRDFLARGRDLASRDALRLGRLTTVLWGTLVTAFAFFVDDISPTVIESINKIGSAFYGPVLAVFLLALPARRPTGGAVAAALVVGVLTNVALWCFVPAVHWMWWNVTGCGITLIAASLGARAAPRAEAQAQGPIGSAPAPRRLSHGKTFFTALMLAWCVLVVTVVAVLDRTA